MKMKTMAQWHTKALLLIVATSLILSGCGAAKNLSKEDIKQNNCSAFNLISLIASNPNVKEVVDFRGLDQKTYENTLFTTKEYCELGNQSLNDVINQYEMKTKFSNSIIYKNGIVTINPSKKNYIFLENSFNFVAVSRDKNDVKYFKNRENIKLGNHTIRIEVLKDYRNAQNPYVLKLYDNKKINKETIETAKIIKTEKNFFTFEDYLIAF